MADKFKKGIGSTVTFVAGEIPTSEKLNALSAQMEKAFKNVEKAIGDTTGEMAPYSVDHFDQLSQGYGKSINPNTLVTNAQTRALDIVNLARLIGPASNLNPHILPEPTNITEEVPLGVYEFSLRYPIEGPVSGVVFSDTAVFDTLVTPGNLRLPGEYIVTQDGKVYTLSPTNGGTVVYTIDPRTWGSGISYQGGTFNVIPDLNQVTGGGPVLSVSGPDGLGRWNFVLPVITHQQWTSNHIVVDGSASLLGDEDPNKGLQLKLPEVLTDRYNVGERIPEGFVYLKNWTTGEVYDNGIYEYISPTEIRVSNIDIAQAVALSHKFILITVGTNITASIDDIRRKSEHSHNRTWGEPLVNIRDIMGWTVYPGLSGQFAPSDNPSNFAPQYLHRDGYRGPAMDYDVNDSNVMRGHLLIGIDGAAAGSAVGQNGATYALGFGDVNSTFIKRGAGMDSDALRLFSDTSPILFKGGYTIGGKVATSWTEAQTGFVVNARIELPVIRSSYQNTVMEIRGDVHSEGGSAGEPYGNFVNSVGNVMSQGLIAGPINPAIWGGNALPKWEIEEDSNDFRTVSLNPADVPNSGFWFVPKFYVLHFSRSVKFSADNIVHNNVNRWFLGFDLPDIIKNSRDGTNSIMGAIIAVRPNLSAHWITSGFTPIRDGSGYPGSLGTRVSVHWNSSLNIDTPTTTSLNGYRIGSDERIWIMIAADGDADVNVFHRDNIPELDPVGAHIQVKITLFVASPTGNPNMAFTPH